MTLGQFIQTIFNDIANFFASLSGRTVVTSPLQQPQQNIAQITTGTRNVPPVVAVVPKPTITPQQAITQAIATETNLNPRDFKTGWYLATNPAWQQEVQNAYIDFGEASQCGGSSAPNLTFQEASSFGLQGASTGVSIASNLGAAIPSAIGGAVIPGIGIVISAISAIFQHHAAAVARDMRAICALLPASNNAFKAIIDAVNQGQLTPSQGAAAMDAIPAQFLAQAGAAKNNSPYCNALCEYLIRVRAIAFYWKSQFLSRS